jgi:glycerate kinase
MKVVIAPDSFKESLTALEVASAIERGWRSVFPKARVVKVPMADGGEGTVQALVDATAGQFVRRSVKGPLGQAVKARYGLLGDGRSAVIEMAEASGLPLVARDARNPLLTSTFGTGELMRDALRRGVRRLIIGLGGSATNDGGCGMAQALGVRFLRADGSLIEGPIGGGDLADIAHVDASGRLPELAKVEVTVACDVDNPLSGRRGAAQVFGPQKGADAAMVARLDAGLKQLGRVVKADLGVAIDRLPGAGAAGGLGGGLVAFCGAELRRGVDIVIEATRLERHLKGARVVITGEGRLDSQTPYGKAPAGVGQLAARHGIPVIAIGGGLADDARVVFAHGIDAIEAAVARPMSLEDAFARASANLEAAGERVARLLALGARVVSGGARGTRGRR